MRVKKDMPKRYHLNRPDLAQAVAVELRTCQDVKSQQRLLAARLAASGQLTAAQIAGQLGISRRRFFDWMNALKAGGLAGLLERQHGGGAVPQVQGDALKELQAGLQSGRWKRAKEIQHWLRERHTIRLKLAGVYYWLGKLGGVLKVPRKTHAQKDAVQIETFQRTLCEQLVNLNVAGGRPVRLWVADEHRYGLIPVVRKCWTLRGVRPTVPYRTKYEWGYLYSALEVDGENAAEFLCLPEVSLEMSGLFLAHLAASDPDAEHIVIWDQAGFHPKPELHAVPEHVHLVPLPPYSPELNPTEAVGDVIKDRIGNELWENLDDLEQAIGEELRPLCEKAECVRRLVSHPWLVEQANATVTENSAITCSKSYQELMDLFFARDSSASRSLNFANAACSRSSPTARICAARIPAFFAAPMPTVATGTPGGICTMDNSESSPFKDLLSIGTPIIGNVVNAAVTPGRCAAPPAPAMMTRSPRPAALLAYCSKSFGVRCAEMTFASVVTPNSASASAAAFIVGQSESLPIKIPTSTQDDFSLLIVFPKVCTRLYGAK